MSASTRIEAQTSDLFFNYEHPTYDGVMADGEESPSEAELKAAMLKDAEDFLRLYGAALAYPPESAQQLADDFWERL